MKKPITKADYKRKKREVRRTSQKLLYSKHRNKFRDGDIVKLRGGEDMGYVLYYRYDKVFVKWTSDVIDSYMENDLIKVA